MEKTLEKNKEHGKASIVLLIGPSSAGKSTICEELLKQNESLPEKERLDWQVWGQDLEFDNFLKVGYKQCLELFGEDERFKAVVKCHIPNTSIFSGIWCESFKDPKTGEILEFDKEKFNTFVDDFIKKTGDCYSKEMLEVFQSLALEKKQELCNAYPFPNMNEKMFDQAIENSRNGKPTILDPVPGGKENLVEEFEKHLEKRNFSCPTHVALVHLPFKDLTQIRH